MFQWIYHTNTKNSLHRAHSLHVTTDQGVEAKVKARIFLSSRSKTVLQTH